MSNEVTEEVEVVPGSYLAIQPVTKWTAMVGDKDSRVPNPNEATMIYDDLKTCLDATEELANSTDLGYRVSTSQVLERLSEAPDVLIKVYKAFMLNGIPREQAIKIVNEMQSEGVVFRERIDGLAGAEEASDEPTEAPETVSEDTLPPGEDA